MNNQQTPTDQRILGHLQRHGPVKSLYRLACCDLGLDYSQAWRTVRRLEAAGLIRVSRSGRTRALVISLAGCGHE